MQKVLFFLLSGWCMLFVMACKKDTTPPETETPVEETPVEDTGLKFLEPSPQRPGDPDAGYEYLVYGNYVNGGFPYELYAQFIGLSTSNHLNRTGDNATVDFTHTVINASNGVKVVTSNCLQCHAAKLNGELIVGLGNTTFDYTQDLSEAIELADLAVLGIHGEGSPEWDAYEPFRRAYLAIAPHVRTEVRGVSSADKLAAVLAAYRNKHNLEWLSPAQLPIDNKVIPTDVPPWWVMKKKNALYYSGLGRGDFARLIMASSVLTLQDTMEARTIDDKFTDVLAYIETIEPPAYPETIDMEKAARGEAIFNANCSSCHGHYGATEDYPNLLVDLDVVGTDPELVNANFAYYYFVQWYNSSWFSKDPFRAFIEVENGYIAPPLDGIWATSPYLHNGSVPTLEDLLNSKQRPDYWRRSFQNNDYDYEKVGWNYSEETEPSENVHVYNTKLTGYGNQGHTFGDALTEEQRSDLVEYLKTL